VLGREPFLLSEIPTMAHVPCELPTLNTRPKGQCSFVTRLLLFGIRIEFKHPEAEESLKLGVPISMWMLSPLDL